MAVAIAGFATMFRNAWRRFEDRPTGNLDSWGLRTFLLATKIKGRTLELVSLRESQSTEECALYPHMLVKLN